MAIVSNSNKALLAKPYIAKRIAAWESVNKKPMSLEKKVVVAHAMKNTAERLKYVEATNPGQIGSYKRYAIDILASTLPNTIAFDLVAVQPLDNRVGIINYINYQYQSNKGAVTAPQNFNGALKGSFSDKDYTSAFVNGETFKSVANQTDYPLSWTPVDRAKGAVVTVDGNPETGFTLTESGISFTTAPTADKDVVVKYYFLNEDVRSNGFDAFGANGETAADGAVGGAGFTNVPEIGLKIESVDVKAQARTLRAYWGFTAEYELSKDYGVSMSDMLAEQAAAEIAHEIDDEICLDLLKSSVSNTNPILTPKSWSKTQPIGVSLADHYAGFMVTVNEMKNAINAATRRVSANFMICGLGTAAVVASIPNLFKPSGNIANGPYYLGMLGDMKVYVDPAYPMDYFVLGYKGSSMFEAGYFYCPYMPVTSTDLIMDADFRGQRAWATMYGKKMINPDLYIAGQTTA